MMDGITNPQEENARAILARWFTAAELRELRITQFAGGLSGARFWKIAIREQSFCLRRQETSFPATRHDMPKIHALITFVHQQGFTHVPVPRQTLAGETFVETSETVWELAHWLNGESTTNPTLDQALAATEALAQFHNIAAKCEQYPAAIATGLKQRLETFNELRQGLLPKIGTAVQRSPDSQLRAISDTVLSQIKSLLPEAVSAVQAAQQKVPLQWCLCDCHIGNFLFVGYQVTGLLDFQAAGVGSVSRDLARLVGSMATNNIGLWRECLAAYQQHRPLSSEELQLVYTFHMSGTVGAAANWLRWRFLDDLPAADAATTQSKLNELSTRMTTLSDCQQAIQSLLGPIS